MRIKKMVSVFVICAMIVLLGFGLASAGLTLSSSSIIAQVDPGQHISKVLNVSISAKDKASNYTIDSFGFGQSLYGSAIDLTADKDISPYSARTLLKITPSSIRLEPGQPGEILVEADIPGDIGDGGRYALINIRSDQTAIKSGAGASLAYNIPILFTISGTDQTKTGEITSLDFSKPNPRPGEKEAPISARQNITAVLKNTGNYHYKVQSRAELKDDGGNILSEAASSEISNSLIPTFSREFQLSLIPSTQLKPGTYYIELNVSNADDGTEIASKEMKFDIKS